jgi:hypothetical protein
MSIVLKDTADVRAKILLVWKLFDEKKMSVAEARVHMGLARTVLETLRAEIMAAHLAQINLPPVSLTSKADALSLGRRQ